MTERRLGWHLTTILIWSKAKSGFKRGCKVTVTCKAGRDGHGGNVVGACKQRFGFFEASVQHVLSRGGSEFATEGDQEVMDRQADLICQAVQEDLVLQVFLDEILQNGPLVAFEAYRPFWSL